MVVEGICPTVHEIEHHNVLCCGIFAIQCGDKRPQEWMKEAPQTIAAATKSYLVEAIEKAHFRSSN